MVDERIMFRLLATVGERVGKVRRHLGDEEGFLGDEPRQELAAFNFEQALQGSLDACAHVIADRGLGVPASAREHFEILARAGLISAGLAHRLAGAAGARNRIAHAYGTLDITRFWTEAPEGVDAMEELAARLGGLV